MSVNFRFTRVHSSPLLYFSHPDIRSLISMACRPPLGTCVCNACRNVSISLMRKLRKWGESAFFQISKLSSSAKPGLEIIRCHLLSSSWVSQALSRASQRLQYRSVAAASLVTTHPHCCSKRMNRPKKGTVLFNTHITNTSFTMCHGNLILPIFPPCPD